MSADATSDTTTRSVTLIGFPLDVARRAYAHRAALLREFAIIALGGGAFDDLPARLVELVKELDERYSGTNPEADEIVNQAIKHGESRVDLAVRVPPRIMGDMVDLHALLVDVDEYCRTGELLTLAPDDELRRFWYWFLGELARQSTGAGPVAWDDFEMPA